MRPKFTPDEIDLWSPSSIVRDHRGDMLAAIETLLFLCKTAEREKEELKAAMSPLQRTAFIPVYSMKDLTRRKALPGEVK